MLSTGSALFEFIWASLGSRGERAVCYRPNRDGGWLAVSPSQYAVDVVARVLALQALGLERGDHLFVSVRSGFDCDILEKAAIFLGLSLIALDSYVDDQVLQRFLSAPSGSRWVVEDSSLLPPRVLREGLDRYPIIMLEELARSEELCRGTAAEIVNEKELVFGAAPADVSSVEESAWDAAALYAITTSGSSGSPKIIVYSQKQVLGCLRVILDRLGEGVRRETVISWLPMTNLFQKIFNLAAFLSESTIYFENDPKNIARTSRSVQPTVLIGVPFFFEKILRAAEGGLRHPFLRWLGRRDFSREMFLRLALRRVFGSKLRFFISGSAGVAKPTLEAFSRLGLPICEAYGLSESVLPVAMSTLGGMKMGSVGRLLSPENVTLRESGEVVISGPFLGSPWGGSSGRPNEVATNDFAILDQDGFLFLKGRGGDFIKTSTGRKISRRFLEDGIRRLPGVANCVLVGNEMRFLSVVISPFELGEGGRSTEPLGRGSGFGGALDVWRDRIEAFNQSRLGFEKIGLAVILDRPFLTAADEVTHNFKLRSAHIEKKFKMSFDGQILPALKRNERSAVLTDEEGFWFATDSCKYDV